MNTINADFCYDAGNAAEEAMNERKTYLCNAFSLQMLPKEEEIFDIHVEELSSEEFEILSEDAICAIGHADTAHVLGCEPNRINVSLTKKDALIVVQLQGGRLPEGAITLPEGFSFKYYYVTLM